MNIIPVILVFILSSSLGALIPWIISTSYGIRYNILLGVIFGIIITIEYVLINQATGLL